VDEVSFSKGSFKTGRILTMLRTVFMPDGSPKTGGDLQWEVGNIRIGFAQRKSSRLHCFASGGYFTGGENAFGKWDLPYGVSRRAMSVKRTCGEGISKTLTA